MPRGVMPDVQSAVEWGGDTWAAQVERGLAWLGPVAGLRIMDLGTRYGGMAIHLAKAGATVVGVDLDRAALDVAFGRATDAGVADRISFEIRSGAADDLPGDFDVVFAKSVPVLSPDLDATIRGIANSLRSGGRLLAIENARGPLIVHAARVVRRRSLRPHGAHYCTPGTVRTVASHFDLDLVRWTRIPPTVAIGGSKRSP